ncbi:nuclear transport factor 2 family protein [Pontibacter anaerobius]|uniref:Nuclear transport factor 2 family protein n=1 Tax=Pontibacter anaerobius TaxID=2993940 RepID=A0ABT3RAG4_9BACT|nr:nuclear transport factor 2 family protein [Pontibacter anaerobius]MCX2738857.1 nuclear transport factor 2 family protein [Pontibacter anaerobius]
MSNEAQQRQIIESYVKAYNAFDVAGMVKDMHHDIVFENIADGITNHKILGISAFLHQAEQATAYFREREQRIKSISFEEDVAEVEVSYSGVVGVDLPNGMQAGEELTLEGKSIFYFENGKITKLQDIS